MPSPLDFIWNTFAEFFGAIAVAIISLLVVLTGGCSDQAKARQFIELAQSSGAAYNVTVSGQPGVNLDLGNRFGINLGTTVTANLSGGFTKPPQAPAMSNEVFDRLDALSVDFGNVLERLGALERAANPTPVNPNP